MEKHGYNKINNLLSHLHNFGVVELVRKKYDIHNNDAPPAVLQDAMDELQKFLIVGMSEEPSVQTQGIFDWTTRLSDLLKAVDPEKLKAILNAIQIENNQLVINLKLIL